MSHVLAHVSTRNRMNTTLPVTLQAIASQTRTPDGFLLLVDDPQETRQDPWKVPLIADILRGMTRKMKVDVIFGPCRGPHVNHEYARTSPFSKDLIWRVDDDEAPEPNVLEILEAHLKDSKVGAAGGLVLTQTTQNPHASEKIEHLFIAKNVQWYLWPVGKVFENAEHLHSTFLYRKDSPEYPKTLSPVAHTEETWFSHAIHLTGKRLVVDPSVITWHYQEGKGGIRSQRGDYAADKAKFEEWAKAKGVVFSKTILYAEDGGVGDTCAAFMAIRDLRDLIGTLKEFKVFVRDENLDSYKDLNIPGLTVHSIKYRDFWCISNKFNVYEWIMKNGRTGNLVHSYREMFKSAIEEVKK